MARYRKIDVRVWSDERFRRLSPARPNAQTLWFFLLTNRFTTNIPGLYSAGEAALAEELNWPLAGFRKAFAEVHREGMAEADWIARVVWVPKAIRYHDPESPNVVKNWRVAFDEIPDCALRAKAITDLEACIQLLHEGYREAFAEAFRHGSRQRNGKASTKPMPIQEQEQEQEQEKNPRSGAAAPAPGVVRDPTLSELEGEWDSALLRRVRTAVTSTRSSGNMAEGPWYGFLLSARQFTLPIRERAACEYLDRAYAAEGKGEKYLLGMMRGGNGRAHAASQVIAPPNLHVDNDAHHTEPSGRKLL